MVVGHGSNHDLALTHTPHRKSKSSSVTKPKQTKNNKQIRCLESRSHENIVQNKILLAPYSSILHGIEKKLQYITDEGRSQADHTADRCFLPQLSCAQMLKTILVFLFLTHPCSRQPLKIFFISNIKKLPFKKLQFGSILYSCGVTVNLYFGSDLVLTSDPVFIHKTVY